MSTPLARRGGFSIAHEALLAALLVLPSSGVANPVSFNGTGYFQNFNSLNATTLAPQPVTNSSMLEVSAQTNGGTVEGWYFYGTNATTRWGVSNGTSTQGSFYGMFDSSGGKALGSLGNPTSQGFFGAVLQNTSGSAIDAFSISYDAVIARNPSTTVNSYPFSWLVSSVAPGTGNGTGTFANAAGSWNSTTLGFTTPSSGPGAPGTQAAISPLFKIGSPAATFLSANWGINQYLYLRWADTDESGNDAMAGVDNFSFSRTRSLTWNLAGGGVWDTTTPNWTGDSTTFTDGSLATFNNPAGGLITLNGTIQPALTVVSAPSGTYTFSGSPLAGTGSISKSGAGALVLSSPGTFTGGASINGGTLEINAADRLGTGTVTLNGGVLLSSAPSAITLPNALAVGSSGGTVDTGPQDLGFASLSSFTGQLVKTGGGALRITGSFSPSPGTGLQILAGSVFIGQASGNITFDTNVLLGGNLTLAGSIRLNVNENSTFSGNGSLGVGASGTLISQSNGNAGGTIASTIALNPTAQPFTPGAWNGSSYLPGNFSVSIGGSVGGGLTINASITGNSDLDISASVASGGGTGILLLNSQSSYAGQTTLNAGTPTVLSPNDSPASVVLGIDNALPVTTGLIAGTKSGLGSAIMDLNGFNQQFAYLADGPTATSLKTLTITNAAAQDSVLTLGGSVTPGAAFSGVIESGTTADISVIKTGANTQTLSGDNTYAGSTLVAGGTLLVTGNHTGGASYTVSGGTLGGTGSIASPVDVLVGGVISPGVTTGILSIAGDVTLTDGSLAIQLNGTTAGSGYDQLVITDPSFSLALTGTSDNLQLTLGFTPATGDRFFLVEITGSSNISETFELLNGVPTNLQQDAEFLFANRLWQISYTADSASNVFSGAGNDLAIQAVIPEPASCALLGMTLLLLCGAHLRRDKKLAI